ncbi:phosphohistidine phosphatase SixA [Leptolyngbya iicbica]|uniref:Phosphohistidine phosphatase SixA n=2 Tax=Cyanophyceae TaxID=3028117 RepID=A0A4Q7E8A8_9CYAN|nr:phosphohistidine phosphatase SixA [Leptolyngbya sp. LK]RZM79410.1 phosphohistidine phosphatase SixA [Leptolyngbya sp. LK]
MASSPQTELYFIRHGIAADRGTYAQDAERPLTEQGELRTAAIADRLVQLGCRVEHILTSPLVRAHQTTQILLEAGVAPTSTTLDVLAPNGNLHTWLDWLTDWQLSHPVSRLALVGHEPDLSNWAQLFVHGEATHNWRLKKAGVIGVEVPAAQNAIGHSILFWFAPPRLLL